MTVSTSDITSGPYTGNGALDEYSYDFTVQNKAHLEVFETTDAGVRTTLTVDVDYTVNDVGTDGGGTITRLAGNLPTDYIWYVRAAYPEDQETDFTALGPFSPAIHELQFDHLTYLVKQLSDKLGRALTFTKELVAPAGVDTTLPPPEASKIAAVWNSAADALELGPTADEISGAQGYATAAAASAASAATTLEDFYEVWCGSAASDATTDLNGGALTAGDICFNETTGVMRVYNSASWGDIGTAQNSASSVNIADAGHYFNGGSVELALQEIGTLSVLKNKITSIGVNNAGSGYAIGDNVYPEGTNVYYPVLTVDGSGAITSLTDPVTDKRTVLDAGDVAASNSDGSGTGATFNINTTVKNIVEVDEAQTLTNKTLTNPVISSGATDPRLLLNTKVLEIGTWDMDADSSKTVAHGVTSSKIRTVSVLIRYDSDDFRYDFAVSDIPGTSSSVRAIGVTSTNISMNRSNNGFFDNTNYDTMGDDGNRGWITIQYTD